MKTGLVLEGGGLRGIFTAGVLDVLMEEGIKFDGAVGVSAGAAFGSNYKSEQNRRAIRYNLRFAKDPRYSSIMSLIATGNLFNAQFCYHDIPEKLDPFDWETFRKNPMEFYLVCTDVETGKAVYHLCDNDDEQEMLEWFRASGSMPLVSRIVEVGDKKLLDGGIADSIPLRFMEEQGYERNLVVLTRPANYVKTGNPLMPMIERGLRDYPEGVEAIRNRHIAYNEEIAYVRQREIGKYAFVIRPDRDLDIGRVEHDRTKIRAAYKAGRRKARKLLPEIMTFLAGAKADFSSINASMVEGDVSVSDVVKPSLVEDPTVVPGEKEGFGKSYEEDSEEITGRENKDIPEELFGKVKRDDTCDGADEEKFEGAPASAAPSADAEAEPVNAATADAESADAKPAGVTSASLVESLVDEPAELAPEQDEDQKVRVEEVRAVILPEEEEELPAFQRPFPMGREQDQAFFEHEDDENTDAVEDTPAVEIAEEEEAAEPEEEAAAVEIAEEEETGALAQPEAGEPAVEEPAAEETAEEAEAPAMEEPTAEEPAEEIETVEVEEPAQKEPAAEEAAEEAEEPAAEEPAAEEAAEEAEELAAEEPAAEETAEEAEEAEVEEPAEEEPAAEEPIEETRFVEPTEEESEEEVIGEELTVEEPAVEEPIAETEEPEDAAAAETADDGEASVEEASAETADDSEASAEEASAETADDSEASAEAEPVKEASGLNPFRYRNKGRKQKKVWKPGNMTALKEKAKDQTK